MYERPCFSPEERPDCLRLLQAAHSEFRLDIAGPLLPFDAEAGLAGAIFLSHACWLLVSGDEKPEFVEKALKFPLNPASPEAHLSGDLCLRFLATVYRRVRIQSPDDPLPKAIVDVLRRWPLSGAGSDVMEPPIGETHFCKHHGLQLLYAERLAANLRPAWIPATGRTREVVELVFQQQGKMVEFRSRHVEFPSEGAAE